MYYVLSFHLVDTGGVQPFQLNSKVGLEFSFINWTSSMSRGVMNPMVSGRKMKRTPTMMVMRRAIERKLGKR